jgi:hypothetical protein
MSSLIYTLSTRLFMSTPSTLSKLLLALVLGAAMVACSTPAETVASNESKQICKRETPTGTGVARTQCRTEEEMKILREQSQSAVTDITSKMPKQSPGN